MRIYKFILVLFITASVASCKKDDDGGNSFTLSNENLAGTYNVASLTANSESTTETSGVTVTIATGTVEGDTFQLDVVFNANGTYTVNGEYRVTVIVTPTGSDPIETVEIQTVNDSGTYQLNVDDQTITMNSDNDSFASGTFEIALFNETRVNLTQTEVEVDGDITTTTNGSINLVRQ